MADRPANTTGKSVSSPGKGSKRTDLSPSKGPIRIAGGKGVPYGSGKQQHQLQAARQDAPSPAPTSPSSTPVSPPAGSTGLDPRSMLGMIGRAPTAFPGDPIGAPQQAAPVAPTRLGDVLAELARVSGSDDVRSLMEQALALGL